jgi:hypothetical protein
MVQRVGLTLLLSSSGPLGNLVNELARQMLELRLVYEPIEYAVAEAGIFFSKGLSQHIDEGVAGVGFRAIEVGLDERLDCHVDARTIHRDVAAVIKVNHP